METDLIAEASMGLMDSFETLPSSLENRTLIAVGMVAIIKGNTSEGEMTFTRTYSTDDIHHHAMGLFLEGYNTVSRGRSPEEE